MVKLASRTNQIDSSGIRKVFNMAQNMTDPVNLSIGQPDFDVPEPVKEAAIQAIRDGFNKYTVTAGIPQLREKVLGLYKDRGYHGEQVIITSGVSGGIMLALLVLLDPGDEIVMPDPYFVMYKHLANFIGAKPVFVDTYPDFRLRAEALEAAITPRTKALILNSPNNPTGIVYSDDEIKAVAGIARKHDLLIITDDIYDHFYYGEGLPPTIAREYPNTLVLSGLSKSSAMTGWRVGFAMGGADVIQAMTELQQYSFVCAPSMAQKAALVALDLDMEEQCANYRKKRDIIYNGLKNHFNVEKPQGAFYIFPEAPGGDGEAFVKKAIENNVLMVPGNVFSEKNSHVRMCFTTPNDTLERGVEILCRLAEEVK
jgi:aspartate/methionine/tyrosine aminotransferase